MKKSLIAFFVFVFVSLSAVSVFANKPVSIGILNGMGFPVSEDWGGVYHTSYYFGFESEIRFSEKIAAGSMVGYYAGHSDGNEQKSEYKNLQLTPYIKYFFVPDGVYNVYGVFGPGIYFVDYDDDSVSPDIDDCTKRYVGYNIGFGASRKITDSFRLGLDIRFHQIFRQQFLINSITPSLLTRWDF